MGPKSRRFDVTDLSFGLHPNEAAAIVVIEIQLRIDEDSSIIV
jgi:hypothetical protein